MTNVLDLSRNFCYNNNREVKAKMTRRTREAMASELKLPQHYVELDEQEMMYVDGGAVYHTTYTNLDGIFMLAGMIGGGVVTAIKGFAAAVATSATVIGAVIGCVAGLAGIIGASYALVNLISALYSFANKGSYTWTEHKVFGFTWMWYVA